VRRERQACFLVIHSDPGWYCILFLWQLFRPLDLPDVNMSAFGSDTVRARAEIIEEGEIDLGGTVQRYQVARVELLEGQHRGLADHGDRYLIRPPGGFARDLETVARFPGKSRCAYTLVVAADGVNDSRRWSFNVRRR